MKGEGGVAIDDGGGGGTGDCESGECIGDNG